MVHPSIIAARLAELRFTPSRWFRSEVQELERILMDHEKIIVLACGRYFGSFALLVATDQRLLLIDKRVFFMNIEDTRYDMISEIEFNSQFYSTTVTVHTINKTHRFTSIKHKQELRDLTNYVQRRVTEFRNQQAAPAMPQPEYIRPPVPAPVLPDPAMIAPAPLGTSYGQSPKTTDDTAATAFNQQAVAQIVGSAAVQASHSNHWPKRPFNPYIQGSLMTRRPIGGQNYNNY